jgi:hypothetical protein
VLLKSHFFSVDMSGIIFVTAAAHILDSDQMKHLMTVLKFGRPVLVCANKAYTHWVDSFNNDKGRPPTSVSISG